MCSCAIENNPKILLAGCGRWGRNILRDLVSLKSDVTVVDPSGEALDGARQLGVMNTFASLNDISGLEDFHGAVVASPTLKHCEVVSELLDKAPLLNIFCEKPLTADSRQSQDLMNRAPNNLFVMDKWRYHPGILALADLVRSSELGKVIGIRTIRNNWGLPHTDVDSVWILLCHEVSILLELLDEIPAPKHAVTDAQNGWAHGIVATLGASPWAVVEVSSRSPVTMRETKVLFEDGVAVLQDAYATSLQIVRSPAGSFNEKPIIEEVSISSEMPLLRELQAFVNFIKGEGVAPKSSAQEGHLIIKTVEKLRELAGLS